MNRLRANLNAGMRAGAPTAQAGSGAMPASALPVSNALPAWAELVGNWQTIAGNGNNAEVRQHTGGIFVGTDQPVGNGWRVGGALGHYRCVVLGAVWGRQPRACGVDRRSLAVLKGRRHG